MVDPNYNIQNASFTPVSSGYPVENKEKEQQLEEKTVLDQFSEQFNPCSIRKAAENGKQTLTIDIEEIEETLAYSDIEDAEELSRQFNHDVAEVLLKKILEKEMSVTGHSWKANSLTVLHHKSGLGLMVPLRDEEGNCKYIEKGEFDLSRFFGDLCQVYEEKQAVSLAIEGCAVPFTLRATYPSRVILPIWTDHTLYVHKSVPDNLNMQSMLDNMRKKSIIQASEQPKL